MINRINKEGLFDGSVVVVQPLERGLADMINAQDGLYTLYLRGIEDGEVKVEKEIITVIKECVNPYGQWEKTVAYAVGEELNLLKKILFRDIVKKHIRQSLRRFFMQDIMRFPAQRIRVLR